MGTKVSVSVSARPLHLFGTEKKGTYFAILPHLLRHMVPLLDLIHEPRAGVVEEQSADAAQRLDGKELDLGVPFFRVAEAHWVDLYLFHVDGRGACEHRKL